MGRSLIPPTNQAEHDIVATPPDLARAIVDHFVPLVPGNLDPCRGDAPYPFYAALRSRGKKGRAGDPMCDWCELREGRDFLARTEPVAGWIVTNPPWSQLRPFLRHALTLSSNVVFLAPFGHFVTRARLRDLDDLGAGLKEALRVPQPPKPWPPSGFELVAMHVQRGWQGPLTTSRLS